MNQLKTPQAFVRRFDAVRARLLQVQIARALLQALLVVMAGLALLAAADYLWEAPRLLRQIGEQLAHGIQAVLHRDMLLAAVFKVRGRAHQPDCLRPTILTVSKPRLRGENLHVHLPGPVRLVRLPERGTDLP